MSLSVRVASLGGALLLCAAASSAHAFQDCPMGVTCTEYKGAGKNGSYFRVTVPEDWDGDLVIVNHGFDLNRRNIRPHEVCQHNTSMTCEQDSDCGGGNVCNNISYLGLDELLLPLGKAVAASTYSETGWAVFDARKDLGEILKFAKKTPAIGKPQRVIVTGFSLGGAMTAEAILRMKIDGAVPLCGAVGGGLPTWDAGVDVRLIYDYLCDSVPTAGFTSAPDIGEPTSVDSTADALTMASKVNVCMGILFPSSNPTEAAAQEERKEQFKTLVGFVGSDFDILTVMGFTTLGVGDFVRDSDRLKFKSIGWNDGPALDYSIVGTEPMLSAAFDAGVERLAKGKGRKKLSKASFVDFTKGKGKKVAYPILSLAGTLDFVVVPEFQRAFGEAASLGSKLLTQSWVTTPGHCVFTPQEIQAVFDSYFAWLDSGDFAANQPTPQDIEDACLALPGGIDDDTCNFDPDYEAPYLGDRVPARSDWTAGALVNP